MYQNILVPLDGSELAECVLPHVESIAKGCGTKSVVFFRVLDIHATAAAQAFIPEITRKEGSERFAKAVREYIDEVASRVHLEGVEVKKEVVEGKPGESIPEYATENKVDLIIIATHGRSGISRWVMGSVADRVLRAACVPVLMIRAPGCAPGI